MCGSPRARTVQSHASCSHRALRARADIHRRAAPTDGGRDWTACSCGTSGHTDTSPRALPPLTPTASHCLQTAGAGVRTKTSPPKTRESAGGAAGAPHLRTSRGSRQSRQQRRARPRQHAASKRLRGGRTGSHLSQGSRPAGPAPLPARAGPSPTFTTSSSAIWQRSAPAPPFRMKTIEPADRTCTVTSGEGVVGGYLESPAHLGQPFGHASAYGRSVFFAG